MEKINFVNGQEPAINGTNLNKIQTNVEDAINEVNRSLETSIGTLEELNTTEKTNLVKAINEVNGKEVELLNEMLMGGNTIELDTSPYKRLLVTFVCYDGHDANTGGSSNVLMMDLENKGVYVTKYIANMLVPYLVNHQMQGQMWCSCEVDSDKSMFTAYVGFGGDAFNGSDRYYVSKIIGIK